MYLYFLIKTHGTRRAYRTSREQYVHEQVWPERGQRNACWLPLSQTFNLSSSVDEKTIAQAENCSKTLLDVGAEVRAGVKKVEAFEARLAMLLSRMTRAGD
jgi:hypothetical protein